MSVEQINFGNLQRKLCWKEFEFSLLRIPQNVKTKNYERLVFEQEKGPVVQWLSSIIIQKLTIRLKVSIEVKCVNLRELKHINANSM